MVKQIKDQNSINLSERE